MPREEQIRESPSIFKAQPLCKLARDKRSNDSERLLPMELYDFRNRLRYWILISFSDKTITHRTRWRESMRAFYECQKTHMRNRICIHLTTNALKHRCRKCRNDWLIMITYKKSSTYSLLIKQNLNSKYWKVNHWRTSCLLIFNNKENRVLVNLVRCAVTLRFREKSIFFKTRI